MVSFEEINNSKIWNSAIKSQQNFNPYQIFEWGEYKKNTGWKVLRLKSITKDKKSYVQICYKSAHSFFFGWVAGSITGDIDCILKENLVAYIKDKFKAHFVYIRVNFVCAQRANDSLGLYKAGWARCPVRMNSEYSIAADLERDLSDLEKGLSANWRRNLRRGKKNNPDITIGCLNSYDIVEINEIFQSFSKLKNVKMPSFEELRHIQNTLGKQIRIAVVRNEDHIISLRAYYFYDVLGIDFWAVTIDEGRKKYSSHVLLWELIQDAKQNGIKEYDFSGIDPIKNSGVYNFKNGTRFDVVVKLGEWEIYNSKFYSFFINNFIINIIR